MRRPLCMPSRLLWRASFFWTENFGGSRLKRVFERSTRERASGEFAMVRSAKVGGRCERRWEQGWWTARLRVKIGLAID